MKCVQVWLSKTNFGLRWNDPHLGSLSWKRIVESQTSLKVNYILEFPTKIWWTSLSALVSALGTEGETNEHLMHALTDNNMPIKPFSKCNVKKLHVQNLSKSRRTNPKWGRQGLSKEIFSINRRDRLHWFFERPPVTMTELLVTEW